MKAIKGCVNRECKSFKKMKHFKESFEYCPQCGEKLEYVCQDCWKVLEQNKNRFCIACKAKREQNRAEKMNKLVAAGGAAVGAGKLMWGKKDQITSLTKKLIRKVKK